MSPNLLLRLLALKAQLIQPFPVDREFCRRADEVFTALRDEAAAEDEQLRQAGLAAMGLQPAMGV